MDIKEMSQKAFKNAYDKGFHETEEKVLSKMIASNDFTQEECQAVINAFIGTGLMLIVSEAAEALEALRKGNNENFDEEIADIAIRIGDFSENYGVDLENEIIDKMATNELRPSKHNKLF